MAFYNLYKKISKENKINNDDQFHFQNFSMINNMKYIEFLNDNYPKLERWYQWFKNTQYGIINDTFRWRGRKINHTLTSGFFFSK